MAFPPPEGHHKITPGAACPNAGAVLEFIQEVFDGKIIERYDGEDGKVMHSEVMIGDCAFMIGDSASSERDSDGAGIHNSLLSYYVDSPEEVDAMYEKAMKAGATSKIAPVDQFYGWRTASFLDMGGNGWTVCCVIEQLTQEEIEERMANMG